MINKLTDYVFTFNVKCVSFKTATSHLQYNVDIYEE